MTVTAFKALGFVTTFAVVTLLPNLTATGSPPANVVLIIADDLGIGDVGCFGNDTIRTPNIDRLAAEGVRLDHHLSAASMCTPSRTAFMTGRYPIRSGMVPVDVLRVNFFLSSTSGLPPEEVTVGELAQQAGYVTGFVGKWHLGMNCRTHGDFCHHPLNQGFDHYYGVPLTNLRDFGDEGLSILFGRVPRMNQVLAGIFLAGMMLAWTLKRRNYIGLPGLVCLFVLSLVPAASVYYAMYVLKYLTSAVMRNFDVVEQPIQLEGFTKRLVREGEEFLRNRTADGRPFLLVMSWIQVHTALHATSPFKGRSRHGPYGDEVEEMDWSVGQILKALDRQKMTDNTFVLFTSDHGGHAEEFGLHGNREGGWNGIFRGGKGQGGMDGGIRVPTVVRWPRVIPPRTVVTVPTSTLDVLPTVARVIGAELPDDRIIDGTDLLPVLQGDPRKGPPHEFLVHYCGHLVHAARYTPHRNGGDVYKMFLATPNWLPGTQGCGFLCDCHGKMVTWHDPPLLYNICRDPSEQNQLDLTVPEHKDILAKMQSLLAKHQSSLEPVVSQFTNEKLVFRPWLQPCCDATSCTCTED